MRVRSDIIDALLPTVAVSLIHVPAFDLGLQSEHTAVFAAVFTECVRFLLPPRSVV